MSNRLGVVRIGEDDVVDSPPELHGKIDAEMAKFDLTPELTPGEEGYRAGWEYATDLFDEQTVARIAEGFERLIKAAVDEPDVQISSVSLMSARGQTIAHRDQHRQHDFSAAQHFNGTVAGPDAECLKRRCRNSLRNKLWTSGRETDDRPG